MVNIAESLTKGEKRMDKMEKDISTLKETSHSIGRDVALIKNSMMGKMSQIDKHEKYFNMIFGMWALTLGIAVILGILSKFTDIL